jgi:AmmeMemoRadiSam system protein A
VSTLTDEDRKVLLRLARTTIQAELDDRVTPVRSRKPSAALREKRGCFVTLHKRKALRGCIGLIEPIRALAAAVEENARNAAFHDPRFSPVESGELDLIDIEISVLSVPRVLIRRDCEELKEKLIPGVHGVIVSKGSRRATFLPQVWEQLPDQEEFLSCLCRKGCMPGSAWQDDDTMIQIYEAEHFSEKG